MTARVGIDIEATNDASREMAAVSQDLRDIVEELRRIAGPADDAADDMQRLAREAKNVGDAGTTHFGRLRSSAKGAFASIKTGIGAGIGIAITDQLAGAVTSFVGTVVGNVRDLDQASHDFQAAAHATAEETESAQRAMQDLFSGTLMSYEEIGSELAALRTDMGLTQEQAEKLARPIADFAKVVGTDATSAVGAMDDILDSWNMSADQSVGIMDLLVASNQQYGTDVTETMGALQKLAPAMQAANFTFEDGVGLMNLFAASGVNSQVATAAFNKALTEVKSPEELQRLLTKISNIEDPMKRAKEATKLFGSRAGPALAQALGASKDGIDTFKLDMDEVGGAVQTASDTIDSSLNNKIDLLVRGLTGAVTQTVNDGLAEVQRLADEFGPEVENIRAQVQPIVDQIGAVGAKMMVYWQTLWGVIQPILQRLATWAGPVIGAAISGLSGLLDGLGQAFDLLNKNILVPLLPVLQDLVEQGLNAIEDAAVAVRDIIQPIADEVLPALQEAGGNLATAVGDAWPGIQSAITTVIDTVRPGLEAIAENVLPAIGLAADALKSALSTTFSGIRTIITGARDVITGAVSTIGNVWNGLIGTFNRIMDGIGAAVRDGINFFIGLWNQIDFRIPPFTLDLPGFSIPNLAHGTIFDPFGTPNINVLGETHARIFEGTSDLIPDIGLVGGGGKRPSSVGMYEDGLWNVPRDMLALIHQDEMVVPADFAQEYRANGGIGGGATVYMTVIIQPGAVRSDRDIRDISERIAEEARLRGFTMGTQRLGLGMNGAGG